MTTERDIIQVALKAGEAMIVHAEGNPAQVVAMGVAAAVVVLAVGNSKVFLANEYLINHSKGI